jgi:hypothetical protein
MFFGWKKRCRHLEVENAQLKAHSAQLEARLTESQAKNQQLLQALVAARKNSRNSSKRPSSDIVKPPPKPLGKGKRRKIGAQPGHPKHEHPAFTPAQIDHHISYELQHCPVDPSHRLVALADQQRIGSSRSRVGEFGGRRAVPGPLTGRNEGLTAPRHGQG